jgi:hypothetical protein
LAKKARLSYQYSPFFIKKAWVKGILTFSSSITFSLTLCKLAIFWQKGEKTEKREKEKRR